MGACVTLPGEGRPHKLRECGRRRIARSDTCDPPEGVKASADEFRD